MGGFIFSKHNYVSLKVLAIYDTGKPTGESLVYTKLKTAQDFCATGDVINGISLRLDDFNRDREVAQVIEKSGHNAQGWTQTHP